ncbi:hypothetical protein G9Q38_07215 [Pusillimonas sp. DMV24BSW_D]|uniref:head-tail connector protein n=1 Tax=Neopusillimonas aestuarii TaxID=2716226 RepID=UPI00140B5EDE|nr:hypothetical protein [Pusillimonas sp. DMV24BSW_D]QIM48985.1 hypothetical protein G9Q38_07215 [Pusillimonas sp. DMV24BSW_D]
MSLKVITPPAAEPVSLQEAKLHLRIIAALSDTATHPEDAMIESLIVAARQGAEHLTGRALMPQTFELGLDGFVDKIKLPMPPLVSITSLTYVDVAGNVQVLDSADYEVDTYSEPAKIVRPYGTFWPATKCQPNAVMIRYEAGYANATDVPSQIKSWMLLRIGSLYSNREDVNVGNIVTDFKFADRLLDAYRTYL